MTTYISVEEAAQKMGLSPHLVRELAKTNQIPALKKGRGTKREHYVILRDAVNGVRVVPGAGNGA